MFAIALFAVTINRLWYALPLVVSISLVWAATRHENMGPILLHALRAALWCSGFLLLAFGVLYVLTYVL